jgi:hypothetical protein
MFGSYSVINIIVLLNMLIAMMSSSYQIISVRNLVKVSFLYSTYTFQLHIHFIKCNKLWRHNIFITVYGTCHPQCPYLPTLVAHWTIHKFWESTPPYFSSHSPTDSFHNYYQWSWTVPSMPSLSPHYFAVVHVHVGLIIHPPGDIWVRRAKVEWYWQGKTEELGEKPVLVPLCPPQIPHGPTTPWHEPMPRWWEASD